VVGAGFVGLETAENLAHRKFDVTLFDMADQVLAPLDREMARAVEGYIEARGVRLALDEAVVGFERTDGNALAVLTRSGKRIPPTSSFSRSACNPILPWRRRPD
jgi:NADPH-dependent 2,4-dienoyl-CoA reductase/sulfur reductase-like enzyme